MRLIPLALAVLLGGCTVEERPVEDVDPGRIEFISVSEAQQRWYTTYVDELEATFRGALIVPPLRIYGYEKPTSCPAPYCVEDARVTIACSDVTRQCIPRLAAALVDQLGPAPLLFRDGLVEVLVGGVGHPDWFDDEIIRSDLNVSAMLSDETYLSERARTDDLRWVHRVVRPAADFTRFLIDELGPDELAKRLVLTSTVEDWDDLGGLENLVERWHGAPARYGRMFRLPLAECARAHRVSLGYDTLPTMLVGLIHAPDLAEPIDRSTVVNFRLETPGTLRVVVESAVDARPFFRVEPCGEEDHGPFYRGRDEAFDTVVTGDAQLPAGSYFLLAGSDGSPASLGEPVLLKLFPTR